MLRNGAWHSSSSSGGGSSSSASKRTLPQALRSRSGAVAMWRRLPTYFPNIRLTMLPLSPEAREQLVTTGWMREVAFKTEPRVNKVHWPPCWAASMQILSDFSALYSYVNPYGRLASEGRWRGCCRAARTITASFPHSSQHALSVAHFLPPRKPKMAVILPACRAA